MGNRLERGVHQELPRGAAQIGQEVARQSSPQPGSHTAQNSHDSKAERARERAKCTAGQGARALRATLGSLALSDPSRHEVAHFWLRTRSQGSPPPSSTPAAVFFSFSFEAPVLSERGRRLAKEYIVPRQKKVKSQEPRALQTRKGERVLFQRVGGHLKRAGGGDRKDGQFSHAGRGLGWGEEEQPG